MVVVVVVVVISLHWCRQKAGKCCMWTKVSVKREQGQANIGRRVWGHVSAGRKKKSRSRNKTRTDGQSRAAAADDDSPSDFQFLTRLQTSTSDTGLPLYFD